MSDGGAIAGWTAAGEAVAYLLCTRGDGGTTDPAMTPDRLAAIRQAEQRAAAAEFGVGEVGFLDHPDGQLQHTLDLRRQLVRAIRRLRPDRLVCWLGSPRRRGGAGGGREAAGEGRGRLARRAAPDQARGRRPVTRACPRACAARVVCCGPLRARARGRGGPPAVRLEGGLWTASSRSPSPSRSTRPARRRRWSRAPGRWQRWRGACAPPRRGPR
jgi:hypothetical protein